MTRQPQLIRLSRRRVLQAGSFASFSAFLAACGGGGSSASPAGSVAAGTPGASVAPGSAGPIEGPLHFANWDAYIDLTTLPGEDGQEGTDDDEYDLPSPTLDEFTQTTGVEVDYQNAVIEDNESFLATIRPQLESGVDTGWDIVVLTDWMAAKFINNGWAEPIDPASIPTALENVRDELKDLPWDPSLGFHVPWQSGGTGIGYNVASTGRELTKIADLFDPAFAGKVTLLSEIYDTFPMIHLMLQAQGQASDRPSEEMTLEDAQAVHAYLKPFVESGHIRGFTGNEYLQDFADGNTWAGLVWSGDLASSGGEDDRFVFPEEGSNIWTDHMLIPKGAVHKGAAQLMMDFVYDVDRAARLANFIYYISPVKGVSEAIKELDPEAAENPLLFPPAEVVAKQHPLPTWDEETEAAVKELDADLAGV